MTPSEQAIHDIVVLEERITSVLNSDLHRDIEKLKARQLHALEEYAKEQIAKDREKLFGEIAEQLWDVKENEDHDYAIGFDENGIPNSVSLEIYGRTHSELSFSSPELENKFVYFKVEKKNLDECLCNLNSVKKVLLAVLPEDHPDKHGDLCPEILTVGDIINQLNIYKKK